MNSAELQVRLRAAGIRPESYSIGGPLPTYEGLILEHSDGAWRIEHFERGMREELESFSSEEQACERMYELLLRHFK